MTKENNRGDPEQVNQSCRRATTRLLLAHLAVGVVAAGLGAIRMPGSRHVYAELGFMSLVISQALLLGIWTGLSSHPLSLRTAGLLSGSAYIVCVAAIGSGLYKSSQDVWFLSSLFAIASTVGILFLILRHLFKVSITIRNSIDGELPTPPRFSIAHMIGAMTAVSLLLGCGQALRSLGRESLQLAILIPTFVGCGCAVAWLVAWAVLEQGRLLPRVFLALVAGCFVGLLPPFYLGGPSWRFLAWPGLILVTEAIAMVYLGVIRLCGYRITINRGELPRSEAINDSLGD